ncbi:MAG TPA: histidinol dehydrogenase [Armatimonadota bacterium]|nr:histidinol dehydrogenase [Armatimonadota bacterium]
MPSCRNVCYNLPMRVLDAQSCRPEELARFLDKPLLQENPEVEDAVRRILADVRERGDTAVLDYVRKFDWPEADSLVVPGEAIEQAYSQVSDSLLAAIRSAKRNIERFHRKQVRTSWMDSEEKGKLLGQMIRPLDRVGVLAPAFQAPLPSSLLMAAVPAKVAGVKELFVSTPPRKDGSIHPAMAVAAAECGADRIFRIGGAHGVAALACGTETVPRVDKIVGPGGVYVTMAKRLVYGQVGIEMLAGPSEVLVLADNTANPRYVAADLLSQAEHDTDARAILITPSRELAEAVSAEVERQLRNLPRREVAQASLDQNGAIIMTASLDEAVELANRAAPEHLELAVAEPMLLLDSIMNAGTILLGEYSTEPLADYVAGPSHILPTSGTARFSSPLNVDDFLKKSSIIMYSREGVDADAEAAIELAEAEGLDGHARAVRARIERME